MGGVTFNKDKNINCSALGFVKTGQDRRVKKVGEGRKGIKRFILNLYKYFGLLIEYIYGWICALDNFFF